MKKSLITEVKQTLKEYGIIFPEFKLEDSDKKRLYYVSNYSLSDEEEIALGIRIDIPVTLLSPKLGRLTYTEVLSLGIAHDRYLGFETTKSERVKIETFDFKVNIDLISRALSNRMFSIDQVVECAKDFVRGIRSN